MHITVTSRYSNALGRQVAAAVLYRANKGTPTAVASFPSYLQGYRLPSVRQCAAIVKGH